jgi:hypothetical protein
MEPNSEVWNYGSTKMIGEGRGIEVYSILEIASRECEQGMVSGQEKEREWKACKFVIFPSCDSEHI